MNQKIDSVSESEQLWIAAQLKKASEFVCAYSTGNSANSVTLEALDHAFAGWMASGAADQTGDVNSVINCVGIAFGQLLVEGLGLSWVIASDEYGSDLAVY